MFIGFKSRVHCLLAIYQVFHTQFLNNLWIRPFQTVIIDYKCVQLSPVNQVIELLKVRDDVSLASKLQRVDK